MLAAFFRGGRTGRLKHQGPESTPMTDSRYTALYRPIGQCEYDLLAESGFTQWPPRLPEQPIFYPVTNEDYAIEIARDWNTKDTTNGNVGYVTCFHVETEYLGKFPIQKVGGKNHTEYWIPAERLDEFNLYIHDGIEVIRKFTADGEQPI